MASKLIYLAPSRAGTFQLRTEHVCGQGGALIDGGPLSEQCVAHVPGSLPPSYFC